MHEHFSVAGEEKTFKDD